MRKRDRKEIEKIVESKLIERFIIDILIVIAVVAFYDMLGVRPFREGLNSLSQNITSIVSSLRWECVE